MTNQEMIAEILNEYGAMTSRQISVQLNVKKGVSLTPAQVAGALRPMVAKGTAANSKDGGGQTRYWAVKQSW
jgi:hypothetical protein